MTRNLRGGFSAQCAAEGCPEQPAGENETRGELIAEKENKQLAENQHLCDGSGESCQEHRKKTMIPHSHHLCGYLSRKRFNPFLKASMDCMIPEL